MTAEYDNLAERTRELAEANERLRAEATERKRVEDALRQSHKMEAIGQLTGGIAHDFNNMLQAIGGSLELMHRRVEQGRAEDAAHFVDGARQTVRRAASLTSRLLAFARRQTLQSKPVVLDTLIEGMAELIQRTVGPSIQVELRMCDGDWTVLCDPNQMESALLNLVINARDAMPDGGTLTIGTEDVDVLQRASSRQYEYAARDSRSCEGLAPFLPNEAGLETHEAFMARLRREHPRKSGFWSLLAPAGR